MLPAWKGETVVILGGGPSLTLAQVAIVRAAHEAGKVRCICINNSYSLVPSGDVCYFADVAWWKVHRDRPDFKAFRVKCSIENQDVSVTDDAVHVLRNADYPQNKFGLSLDPQKLGTGRHGGFQSLNLAILAGATEIILLGYDGHEPNGKTHWHNGHATRTPPAAYDLYKESFRVTERDIAAAGVRVINASPGTAINAFEKMKLEDALAACLERHQVATLLPA